MEEMKLTKEDFEKAKEAMEFHKIEHSVIFKIINYENDILQNQKLRELVEEEIEKLNLYQLHICQECGLPQKLQQFLEQNTK